MPTPDQLFARYAQEGDLDALARLFDRLAPVLRRIALRIAPERSLADDLVQEVFLTAVEKPEYHDPNRPVTAWLIGILSHRASKARRASGRVIDTGRLEEREPAAPSERIEREELARSLKGVLSKLEPSDQALVTARLVEGRSGQELAQELGIQPGTLRVRLHRAIARMRDAVPAGFSHSLFAFSLRGMKREVLAAAAGRTGGGAVKLAAGWPVLVTLGLALVAVGYVVWDRVWDAPTELVASAPEAMEGETLENVNVTTEREEVVTAPQPFEGVILVVDENGAPVSNRAVEVDVTSGELSLVTDEHGQVRFRLEPEEYVRRAEASPGELTTGARVFLGSQAQHVEWPVQLEVTRGASISGRVIDPNGEPVANMRVRGWCKPDPQAAPHRLTRTDAEGRFALANLGSRVLVLAGEGETVSYLGVRGSVAPGDVVTNLELQVGPQMTMAGVVQDTQGNTLAGIELAASHYSGGGSQTSHPGLHYIRGNWLSAVSNEKGEFSFVGGAGRQRLKFRQAPFRDYNEYQDPGADMLVVLDRGLGLRGRVHRKDGQPVAGARVRAPGNYSSQTRVTTDEEGRFAMWGVDPEATFPHFLTVSAEGHAVFGLQPVEPTRERDQEIRIDLVEERVIQGRVIGPDGPLSGIELDVIGSRVMDWDVSHNDHPNTLEYCAGENEVVSDAQGEFTFDRLYAGTFLVRASWDGAPGIEITRKVPAGQTDLVIDFAAAMNEACLVRGRTIESHSGDPIQEMWVSVVPEDYESSVRTSQRVKSQDGSWTLYVDGPGTFELSVSNQDYEHYTEVITLSQGEYDAGTVALVGKTSIEVEVREALTGALAGNARLSFSTEGGRVIWVRTSETSRSSELYLSGGRGFAHDLPRTRVLVEAKAGNMTSSRVVDLSQAQPQPIVFEVAARELASVPLLALEVGPQVDRAKLKRDLMAAEAQQDANALFACLTQDGVQWPTAAFELRCSDDQGNSVATWAVRPLGAGGEEEMEELVVSTELVPVEHVSESRDSEGASEEVVETEEVVEETESIPEGVPAEFLELMSKQFHITETEHHRRGSSSGSQTNDWPAGQFDLSEGRYELKLVSEVYSSLEWTWFVGPGEQPLEIIFLER